MAMKKRFCRTLLAFLAAITICTSFPAPRAAASGALDLTEEERTYLETAAVLRVGYVQDRVPVSFTDENGELAGVSRYIFDRIQRLSGLHFQYIPLSSGLGTEESRLNGKVDLVAGAEYSEEDLKAGGMLRTEPYFVSCKVAVARQDFSYVPGAALSVAVPGDSRSAKKALAEKLPNGSVLDYDTVEDCISAVDRGEADLMFFNQYVVEYWLHRPAYEDLKVIPLPGLDEELCFSVLVPPDREKGELLVSILNKAISRLEEAELDSFTIQATMENRYVFTAVDFLYRYRIYLPLFTLTGALVATLLVLLLRQRLQSVEAQADARAKSRFLSTMSHEVRTPLNGLIGLNYLMSRKLDDREQLALYLEQSTTTARYLLALVSDILELSQLQNGEIVLERKPVDLDALLRTVEAIVQSGMAEKKIRFQTELCLPCPVVAGDGVRIQQILLNLLDNARKFTQEGGRVTVSARQTLAEDGQVRTRVDVSDTGKGMSEAFQKKIFDAFVQERDTVSKGDRGVGLGLSICHRLARLMQGELSFTSQLGQGSVFSFSFTAPPASLPGEDKAPALPAPGGGRRILVAEDNELNGQILLELLEENGFRAELEPDGRAALEAFARSGPGEFSVILMDLLMPRMDGFAAAAAIRALDREDAKTVRILACSANCTPADRDRALAGGMDDFLCKPIDMELLLQKLGG